MCLIYIDTKPEKKYRVGYKTALKKRNGKFFCWDYGPKSGTVEYPLNRWIKDKNTEDISMGYGSNRIYPAGFHISLNKGKILASCSNRKGSIGIVAIKVRFRKVVATDMSSKDSCYGKSVVAREIINLGEITNG